MKTESVYRASVVQPVADMQLAMDEGDTAQVVQMLLMLLLLVGAAFARGMV